MRTRGPTPLRVANLTGNQKSADCDGSEVSGWMLAIVQWPEGVSAWRSIIKPINGETLRQVTEPDRIVTHEAAACRHCG